MMGAAFWIDLHTCFLPTVEDKQSGIMFELGEDGVIFSYQRRVEGEYLVYSAELGPLQSLYHAAIYALEILASDEFLNVTFEGGPDGVKRERRRLSSWFEYDEAYLVKTAEAFLDEVKEKKS